MNIYDKNVWIVIISALTAAVSFVAFALPLVLRSEKKERYKEVIEKKRRALFDQAREGLDKRTVKKETSSGSAAIIAADALASDDSAFTLRFKRKRARITADRFDKTSLKDDPVSLWICSAVANICASGNGMRCDIS